MLAVISTWYFLPVGVARSYVRHRALSAPPDVHFTRGPIAMAVGPFHLFDNLSYFNQQCLYSLPHFSSSPARYERVMVVTDRVAVHASAHVSAGRRGTSDRFRCKSEDTQAHTWTRRTAVYPHVAWWLATFTLMRATVLAALLPGVLLVHVAPLDEFTPELRIVNFRTAFRAVGDPLHLHYIPLHNWNCSSARGVRRRRRRRRR